MVHGGRRRRQLRRWLTGAQPRPGPAHGEGAGLRGSRPTPAPPLPPTSAGEPHERTMSGITRGHSPPTPLWAAARSGRQRGKARAARARQQPMGERRGAGQREAMRMVRAPLCHLGPRGKRAGVGSGPSWRSRPGLHRSFCRAGCRGCRPAPPPGGYGSGRNGLAYTSHPRKRRLGRACG